MTATMSPSPQNMTSTSIQSWKASASRSKIPRLRMTCSVPSPGKGRSEGSRTPCTDILSRTVGIGSRMKHTRRLPGSGARRTALLGVNDVWNHSLLPGIRLHMATDTAEITKRAIVRRDLEIPLLHPPHHGADTIEKVILPQGATLLQIGGEEAGEVLFSFGKVLVHQVELADQPVSCGEPGYRGACLLFQVAGRSQKIDRHLK